MKVVIVHNIIAPYRIPLFNLLAASPEIDLTVLFMAETEANRRWNTQRLRREIRFPYEVLRGAHLGWGETTLHINPWLVFRLWSLRPDVVIVTSLSAATAMCLASRRASRPRVVSWWAGTARTEAWSGPIRRAWRGLLIPKLDAFLCYGDSAAAYIRQAGFPAERIFAAGNVTLEAEDFHRRVELARSRASAWRTSVGLQDMAVVLSVGQIVPRKNHQGLLEAFSQLQGSFERTGLVIVGEGPLRSDLERMATERGLRRVIFTGHVEPDELPMYYAAADLFLDLTLRDHWSQVVGEAMAAGLPSLVSSADHASELIDHGVSGYVVDPSGPTGISSLAMELLGESRKAKRVGEAAFEAVRRRDVHRTLDVFLNCLNRIGRVTVTPSPDAPRGSGG